MSITVEYLAHKYPGPLTADLMGAWREEEAAEKVLLEAKKAFEMWNTALIAAEKAEKAIAKDCLSKAYIAMGTAKAEYMKALEEHKLNPSEEVKERLVEAIEMWNTAKKLVLPAAQRYWELL